MYIQSSYLIISLNFKIGTLAGITAHLLRKAVEQFRYVNCQELFAYKRYRYSMIPFYKVMKQFHDGFVDNDTYK